MTPLPPGIRKVHVHGLDRLIGQSIMKYAQAVPVDHLAVRGGQRRPRACSETGILDRNLDTQKIMCRQRGGGMGQEQTLARPDFNLQRGRAPKSDSALNGVDKSSSAISQRVKSRLGSILRSARWPMLLTVRVHREHVHGNGNPLENPIDHDPLAHDARNWEMIMRPLRAFNNRLIKIRRSPGITGSQSEPPRVRRSRSCSHPGNCTCAQSRH